MMGAVSGRGLQRWPVRGKLGQSASDLAVEQYSPFATSESPLTVSTIQVPLVATEADVSCVVSR